MRAPAFAGAFLCKEYLKYMKVKHFRVLSLSLVCLGPMAQEIRGAESYESFRDKCVDQSGIDLVTGLISYLRSSSLLDHCGIEPWRKSNRRALDLQYANEMADLDFRSEVSLASDSYGIDLTRKKEQSPNYSVDEAISKDILQGWELRVGAKGSSEVLESLDGYRNEGSLVD